MDPGGGDLMTETHVRTREELVAASGSLVVAHGRYEARPVPVRGIAPPPRPVDRAVVVLDDGLAVWLEPLDEDTSLRPADERTRFDGVAVRARGIAHEFMPYKGESPLAPCLSGVHDLEEEA
jgi:hypothetical protein